MRKIFIFFGAAVFLVALFAAVPQAKAMTVEELMAAIVKLQAQIVDLQKQLSAAQSATQQAWCHDFNTNLRIGDIGPEVLALQTALGKDGFPVMDISENGQGQNSFGEFTSSAVVGFQEKYASEILIPIGLKHGTGFVGQATRAKLNQLYGCSQTIVPPVIITPSITVLSPNGGEQWAIGGNYTVKWTTVNISASEPVAIFLVGNQTTYELTGGRANAGDGAKTVTIPNSIPVGSLYKVEIVPQEKSAAGFGRSNGYISIVAATTGKVSPCPPYGDINNDGNVTSQDVDLVSKYLVGTATLTNSQKTYADVNADGLINSADLLLIQKYILGTTSTFPVCTATVPSITVLSPNGGEKWEIGKTYTIRWQSSDLDKVLVKILDYKIGFESNIATEIPAASGSYSWTVPATLSSKIDSSVGDRYKFFVGSWNGNTQSYEASDYSDNYFSIVAATVSPSKASPCGSYGDINSDGYVTADDASLINKYIVGTATFTDIQKTRADVNNDGLINSADSLLVSKYVGGTINTFGICSVSKASPCGSYGDINSDGYVTDSDNTLIKQYVAGTVSFTDIQKTRADLNNDKLISSGDALLLGQYVAGTINTFGICSAPAPSITVVSPNGGEQWQIGNTYQIQWKSQGVDKVSIRARNASDSPYGVLIASGVTGSIGTYSWTISSANFSPRNDYKISISGEINGTVVADDSDNYFNIMAATVTTPKIREQISSCLSSISSVWVVRNGASLGYSPTAPVWANDLSEILPREEPQMYLTGNCTLTYNNYTYNLISGWNKFVWEPASSIIVPSIAVISPNGGENWAVGNTYTVKWTSSNLPAEAQNRISIWLMARETSTMFSIAINTANDGSENWTIPAAFPQGAYKMTVSCSLSSGAACAFDFGDNYFNIVSSITAVSPEDQLASIAAAISNLAEEIKNLFNR